MQQYIKQGIYYFYIHVESAACLVHILLYGIKTLLKCIGI